MKSLIKIFKPYNRKDILDTFSKLDIRKNGNVVNTTFKNILINSTIVSKRYEAFDISSYISFILPKLEQNFQINEYYLRITSGVQILELISDKVEINGVSFFKSFFIINSSNKSRALSFNLGLKSNNFYMVGSNMNFYKKHLTGITKNADEITGDVTVESFDEQIESIKNLFGNKVLLSKVREVILGNTENIPAINHKKFDAFKNVIRYGNISQNLTDSQKNILKTNSEKISKIDKTDDFYLDAFYTLQIYLSIFRNQDPYIVRKETKRILDITQWAVRNNVLESLGI